MSYQVEPENYKDPVEIRQAFVDTLIEEARDNKSLVVLDADLMSSSGLGNFARIYPDRAFNLGIMEAHMVGAAAGLSLAGFTPVVHTFAPFASRRVFDQAVLSGAYANNSITIVGTDPGLSAALNGGTHTVLEDIAMYRSVPNTIIFDISDSVQVISVLRYRIKNSQGLCYIRLSRRGQRRIYREGSLFTPGEFPLVRDGKDITIFVAGILVSSALDAADILQREGVSVRILDCFSLSQLDVSAIKKASEETMHLVAIDNHNVNGGLASAIADILVTECPKQLHRIGMSTFSEAGTFEYLLDKFGYTGDHIANRIRKILN